MRHSNEQNGVYLNDDTKNDDNINNGDNLHMNNAKNKKSYPKLGPEPTLLSRNEVDALYETVSHAFPIYYKSCVNWFYTKT